MSQSITGTRANGKPFASPDYEVIVMGAGFGGLGTGVELRKHGVENFLILDKHPDIGGTWYANTYPGVAVDVPSVLYSFSYEKPKTWSRFFAPGHELKAYADQVADNYGLRPHIRCNAEVVEAKWDDAAHLWTLTLSDGEQLTTRFVVYSLGGLEVVNNPDIDGIDSFAGKIVHTARWDHDFDYRGKRIGVIGTGASALQLVPKMAEIAAELTVFQRHAIWVAAKPDFRVDRGFKQVLHTVPGLRWAVRMALGFGTGRLYQLFCNDTPSRPALLGKMQRAMNRSYHKQLPDRPDLAEKLTPEYDFGCKRPSVSNEYIRSFGKPHVHLVTDSIEKITPDGVVTVDGTLHDLDVLVTATGFKLFEKGATPSIPVYGRDGLELGDFWDSTMYQAYQGVTVPKFPNFFTILGPYGLTGLSYLHTIEATSAHAVRAIARAEKIGATAVEVKQEPHEQYLNQMLERSKGALWTREGCANSNSYYVNSKGQAPVFRLATPLESWRGNKFFPYEHYHWRTGAAEPSTSGRF